jgi:membrane-associated protease RseP (regulator of RpoE activity)
MDSAAWNYLEIVSTLLFFVAVGLMLVRDRRRRGKKGVEFHGGIVIRRMYRGREAIDLLVRKHRRAMRVVGNLAVAISLVVSVVGFVFMVVQTATLQQAYRLVLPSVSGVTIPGPVISVPFWYWIVVVFTVMASHETLHAVFARLEGIELKNYGLMFLLALPLGAFVEFDMEKVKRLQLMKKLRIFAAGSFGNFAVAVFVFLIALASVHAANWSITTCVGFEKTIPGTPAAATGLSGCIYEIDRTAVTNTTVLDKLLNGTSAGSIIIVKTTDGEFDIRTIESPYVGGKAFIGIQNVSTKLAYSEDASSVGLVGLVPDYAVSGLLVWFRLLEWLFLISLGVGAANLLPMKPFDGGLMLEEIVFERLKDRRKAEKVAKVVSVVVAGLLVINIFVLGLVRTVVQLLLG